MKKLPFTYRGGEQFRLYKTDDGEEGGYLSKESEEKFLSTVSDQTRKQLDAFKLELKNQGIDTESIDTLKKLQKSIEDAKTISEVTDMRKQLNDLAVELRGMKEAPILPVAKLPETLEFLKNGKTYVGNDMKSVPDALLAMQKGNKSIQIQFEVKTVGTMTTGNVVPTTPGGIAQTITSFDPNTTPTPRVRPFFMEYMNSFPIDTNVASWAEMKNQEGGAAMTAEGSLKSQADFEYVEGKANVETVTAFIKTSKQALADIGQLRADIDGELRSLVTLKADTQAFNGDGSTPNLKGISEYAVAFTGGTLAGTIQAPNEFDVITAGVNQVATAEVISGTPAGFMATHVFINPTDYTRMLLRKTSTDEYLYPVMLVGVDKLVSIPIVSNPLVPAGDFLIGDMTKANLRMREAMMISVGYENDDFTKNLVTILGEMRLVTYVKSNHVKAFVYGTFDTAIAALLTT